MKYVLFSRFKSYFSDHFQSVSVNGTLPTLSPLLYSVPQGFVLGPILFVLYTYPVFTIVYTLFLSLHSFSENNQLCVTRPISELSSLELVHSVMHLSVNILDEYK